jgi:hypothetical protein
MIYTEIYLKTISLKFFVIVPYEEGERTIGPLLLNSRCERYIPRLEHVRIPTPSQTLIFKMRIRRSWNCQ